MVKRGQASIEYIAMFGIMLAALTPLWLHISGSMQVTNEQLQVSYAKHALAKITEAADLVYVQGEPARITLQAYIPRGTFEISISDHIITLKLYSRGQLLSLVDYSIAPMEGNLSVTEGKKVIQVSAGNQKVSVTNS